MKLYICEVTNEITEEVYEDYSYNIESSFCIVEKYEYAYKRELPRFQKVFKKNRVIPPYGPPYKETPRKGYFGIGNSPEADVGWWDYEDTIQSEQEAVEIRKELYSEESCDVVWFRVHGSVAAIPEGFELCGYDITFAPEIEGAYSIINDCMFICTWHGCDEEGTAFIDYFNVLNTHGLFDDTDTALAYMRHYLSFDWSERGEYCICEIYRKN